MPWPSLLLSPWSAEALRICCASLAIKQRSETRSSWLHLLSAICLLPRGTRSCLLRGKGAAEPPASHPPPSSGPACGVPLPKTSAAWREGCGWFSTLGRCSAGLLDCNGACVRPGTKTLPLWLGWGRGTTAERGAGARPLHPLLVHQPQHLQRLLCHLPAGLHSGCLRGHLAASLPLRTEDRGAAGGRDWGQRGEAMLGLGPPVLCGAGCQHSVGLSLLCGAV